MLFSALVKRSDLLTIGERPGAATLSVVAMTTPWQSAPRTGLYPPRPDALSVSSLSSRWARTVLPPLCRLETNPCRESHSVRYPDDLRRWRWGYGYIRQKI